jgi:hypothetical protein
MVNNDRINVREKTIKDEQNIPCESSRTKMPNGIHIKPCQDRGRSHEAKEVQPRQIALPPENYIDWVRALSQALGWEILLRRSPRCLVVRACSRMVSLNYDAAPDEQEAITSQHYPGPASVSCSIFGRRGV